MHIYSFNLIKSQNLYSANCKILNSKLQQNSQVIRDFGCCGWNERCCWHVVVAVAMSNKRVVDVVVVGYNILFTHHFLSLLYRVLNIEDLVIKQLIQQSWLGCWNGMEVGGSG